MSVQIPVTITDMQYRILTIVADKREVQVHHLIEQLVAHATKLGPTHPARAHMPVTDAELAQIRDGNALGRSDARIAEELGWSEARVTHYRRQRLGLPGVRRGSAN